jgi:hypothetical protein
LRSTATRAWGYGPGQVVDLQPHHHGAAATRGMISLVNPAAGSPAMCTGNGLPPIHRNGRLGRHQR